MPDPGPHATFSTRPDAPAAPTARGPLGHVVVVGTGLAGVRTVLELRAQGFTGRVTVLGAEPVAPYDRPPLSKHLLDRPAPAWLADELGVDALAQADDVRLATRATGLRVHEDGVTVHTDAGPVRADAVVVATGAAAVHPPAWPSALTLHTAADAQRLREALAGTGADGGPRRLVVIGAGWIGAEVATVATAAGVDVTVVEARSVPLAAALGERVGGLTAPWFAAAGVRLRTGVAVAAVDPGSGTSAGAVTLADGTVLPADVVLAAVGARPATAWLAGPGPDSAGPDTPGAPVAVDAVGAVVVDERHAPVDGSWRVRVVGDAARRRSPRHGWVPGGHWDAALRGPAVAVAGLLGHEPAEPDLAPYVFSTQLGHELALYGTPGVDDEVLLRGDPAAGDGWTALWFAPGTDRLTAVFAVDRPRDVGGARRLLAGAALPVLDRALAADPAVPLPRTVAG
ncbi:NAD(P)/FAD-dependent oxidoreductase [Cellulomonas sp. NPDC058312]|uniref:NAD(P)/FAD-dependent oxidoreductase n=1 Tax=Cellulomonas sp. NPDC058312 TaxID=3346441 RepID=UPI0036EE5BEB